KSLRTEKSTRSRRIARLSTPLSSPAPRASSLRRAVRVLRLLNQFVQGRVDRLRARVADPFVTDDSLVIEDVVGRCAARTPFGGDDSAVRKCTPVQLLLLHHGFEFLRFVSETVDAE